MILFKKNIKHSIISILNKFKVDGTMVTFEELNFLPKDVILEINPKKPGSIQTERISSNEFEKIVFKVTMLKDEQWSIHKHDCDEIIVMRKGTIKDNITNKELYKGGFLFIPKFISHSIIAVEDSEFYVEFEKPNN